MRTWGPDTLLTENSERGLSLTQSTSPSSTTSRTSRHLFHICLASLELGPVYAVIGYYLCQRVEIDAHLEAREGDMWPTADRPVV